MALIPDHDEKSQSQLNHLQYPDLVQEIFYKYPFVYCWVEGDSIRGAAHQFDFNFKLWLRSNNEPISFYTNFKTLQLLLWYIHKEKIYFATQGFPSCRY